jgi:hypothetical protein
MTALPPSTEPVKINFERLALLSSLPVLLPPVTTCMTPSGKPASVKSSPILMPTRGDFSDGLSTTVLPSIMAMRAVMVGMAKG